MNNGNEVSTVERIEKRGQGIDIKSILADKKISKDVKAELLLKICGIADIIKPEKYDEHFKMLQKLYTNLTQEKLNEYALFSLLDNMQHKKLRTKFAAEFISKLKNLEIAPGETKDQDSIISDFNTELKKKWWYPGKKYLRYKLMHELIKSNRKEAFKYLKYFDFVIKKETIKKCNNNQPITASEWEIILESDFSCSSVLFELLDNGKNIINISENNIPRLKKELLSVLFNADDPHDGLSYSSKTVTRYFRLVQIAHSYNPASALTMTEEIFDKICNFYFSTNWPQQFTLIRRILNEIAEYPTIMDDFYQVLKRCKAPLKEIAVSNWGALKSKELEDARKYLAQVLDECDNHKEVAEAWFLVTLIRRGLPEIALTLAKESGNYTKFKSRLRRAIVQNCNFEKIASLLDSSEIQEDVIAGLFAKPLSERIEYLRALTDKGNLPLPAAIWKQPSFGSSENINYEDETDYTLLVTYSISEVDKNKFPEYVRMNGYGQYNYEEIDPILFATFIEWDKAYPDEVPNLIKQLWTEMRPKDDLILRADLLRNTLFTRCRKVFSAVPELLDSLLIKYVKERLVDNGLYWSYGQTNYSLKLPDTMPFQYMLICAEMWAKYNPQKSDELVIDTIYKYPANEEWMRIAAEIYSSDKGLLSFTPPVKMSSILLNSWQKGVNKFIDKDIILYLTES